MNTFRPRLTLVGRTLGADGYRLQRRLVDADYEVIANVDEASYSDLTAAEDVVYEYRVAATLGKARVITRLQR